MLTNSSWLYDLMDVNNSTLYKTYYVIIIILELIISGLHSYIMNQHQHLFQKELKKIIFHSI